MLRIWSEHLPLEEARRPEVLEALDRWRIHPIFALRPGDDYEAYAALGDEIQGRDLEFGVWPLLAEEEGYWPSVRNAASFARRVRTIRDTLAERGVRPDWVAFDLEPPLADGGIARSVGRMLRRAVASGPDLEGYERAMGIFRRLIEELEAAGIRSLGVTSPTAAADLEISTPVWQRALEIPWEPLPWASTGVMAYGSMISGVTGGWMRYEDVRAVQYEFCRRLRRRFGNRAHVSLGLTGTGVLGDEPTYDDPGELALDVAAARAAGVDDIAIFCLEGILEQPRPKRWFEAIRTAEPSIPERTWRAESVLFGASLTTRLLGGLAGGARSSIRTDPVGS